MGGGVGYVAYVCTGDVYTCFGYVLYCSQFVFLVSLSYQSRVGSGGVTVYFFVSFAVPCGLVALWVGIEPYITAGERGEGERGGCL